MATTYLYGPYYVIEGPDTPFRPGEVRSYGFGPWRPFRDGTVTISANIQDFGALCGGTTRAITIDSIEYFIAGFGYARSLYPLHLPQQRIGADPGLVLQPECGPAVIDRLWRVRNEIDRDS